MRKTKQNKCVVTERDRGLDGALDPFEGDSWGGAECEMLLTTWPKVGSVSLSSSESWQGNFSKDPCSLWWCSQLSASTIEQRHSFIRISASSGLS